MREGEARRVMGSSLERMVVLDGWFCYSSLMSCGSGLEWPGRRAYLKLLLPCALAPAGTWHWRFLCKPANSADRGDLRDPWQPGSLGRYSQTPYRFILYRITAQGRGGNHRDFTA